MPDARAQLSLPAVEAALGVAILLAVAATFGVAVPDPPRTEAQLDRYAADTARVLSDESPRHAGSVRLAEVARSEAAFTRERDALRRRVAATLGENLFFRVETPHGAVGYATPRDVPLGRAVVLTRNGEIVIWVWYA
ncbi:MAG: hypothetical protein ABEI75_03585 [Halobaculum sp.]